MDSEKIRQLLEKYWNAETSLEEEQALRTYFNGPAVADEFREAAHLFRYFQHEQTRALNENFEKSVTKKLSERRSTKIVSMVRVGQVLRIAAGIGVVVAAGYLIRQEIRKSYPKEMQDTYSDPQMALEETKKALMMISNSFNSAQRDVGQIKSYNTAVETVQGKATKEIDSTNKNL